MEADKSRVQEYAHLLASRGQYEKAIAEWKKLITDSPIDGTTYNNIGDLHLKRHSPSEAIEAYFQAGAAFQAAGAALKAIAVYKKILKIDPARHKAYQCLGDLHAERGLINNAISDYSMLAKLYLKEGMVRDALAVYRRIEELDPTRLDVKRRIADLCLQENLKEEAVQAYLRLGQACTAQQRPEEATEAYQAALRVDPTNPKARQLLEDPQAALQDFVQSRQASRETLGGVVSPASLEEAVQEIGAGRYDRAESMLSELLSAQPGDPHICRLLGVLYLKRGELSSARNLFRFLAESAMRAKDYGLAESMLRDYLQVAPSCVTMLELLGRVYEEKGDGQAAALQYAKALESLLEHPDPEAPTLPAELFAKVSRLAPDSPLIGRLAALINREAELHELGQTKEVLTHPPVDQPGDPLLLVDHLVLGGELPPAASPDDRSRYQLGLAYKKMGLLQEAIEEFRQVGGECRLDAHLLIAACLKEQGLTQQAIRELEDVRADVSSGASKSPAVQYELGLLYESEGQLEQAAHLFSMIPDFLDAGLRLQQIRKAEEKELQRQRALERVDALASASEEPLTTPAQAIPMTTPGQKKRRISYL